MKPPQCSFMSLILSNFIQFHHGYCPVWPVWIDKIGFSDSHVSKPWSSRQGASSQILRILFHFTMHRMKIWIEYAVIEWYYKNYILQWQKIFQDLLKPANVAKCEQFSTFQVFKSFSTIPKEENISFNQLRNIFHLFLQCHCKIYTSERHSVPPRDLTSK